MKLVFKILSLLTILGLAAHAEPANKKCPVSGRDVDASATAKYTSVIGFCCNNCKGKFTKAPTGEKFVAALKAGAGKAVNSKCPLSGEDVDASKTASHDGQTVAFCCGNCLGKFKKDPSKIIAKVKADAASNEKCPVSGRAVDAATAVAHTTEVGFCCKNCLAKFKKDPAAVLNK